MVELIVVRHGETDWNRVRRLQGHVDTPLNAAGIEQAVHLAAALANEPIAAIYSSDLARALATARPVAAGLGLPVRSDMALRERGYGVLEGRTYQEIELHHPDEAEKMRLRDARHAMEGGESLNVFHDRVVDAVSAIARAHEREFGPRSTALVVTHGGVLDMLYREAHGLAFDAERPGGPIRNALINRLAFDDGRFVVRSWGEETGPPS